MTTGKPLFLGFIGFFYSSQTTNVWKYAEPEFGFLFSSLENKFNWAHRKPERLNANLLIVLRCVEGISIKRKNNFIDFHCFRIDKNRNNCKCNNQSLVWKKNCHDNFQQKCILLIIIKISLFIYWAIRCAFNHKFRCETINSLSTNFISF